MRTYLTKLCSILTLTLIATGCATVYAPPGDYGGFPHGGYTDTRINANTVIISFNGNIFTQPSTSRTYVLYRAARVTMENGYDYFIMTSSSTCPMNVNVYTRSTYNGYVTDPPKLYDAYSRSTEYSGYDITKTATQPYYRANPPCKPESHTSVAIIKMFQGKIPTGVPNAYSVQDVIAHLGPAITE